MKIVYVVAAGLVLAGCSSGEATSTPPSASAASSAPAVFDVTGRLTLTTDVASKDSPVGPMCAGINGFDDVTFSEPVTVLDASGTSVGSGKLQTPTEALTGSPPSCTFGFQVFNVPAGEKTYSFRIGTRGSPDFTEDQMRSGPALTLGT